MALRQILGTEYQKEDEQDVQSPRDQDNRTSRERALDPRRFGTIILEIDIHQ